MKVSIRSIKSSEANLVGALQLKHFAGVIRRGELEAEALDDLAGPFYLRRVRGCELAGADPERILEADAHIATHRGGHGGDRHLIAAGAEHRPMILVTEQAVGGPL